MLAAMQKMQKPLHALSFCFAHCALMSSWPGSRKGLRFKVLGFKLRVRFTFVGFRFRAFKVQVSSFRAQA